MIKLLVLFCVACFVRASVIVNIYEDVDDKSLHSWSDCSNLECDQHCRKYGISGACDGDKCKCDILHPMRDETFDFLAKSPSLEVSTYNLCFDGPCDFSCVVLGYTGGICSGGECFCWKYGGKHLLHIKKSPSANSVNDCSDGPCNDLCKKLGFPGGSCLGGKCNCRSKQETGEVLDFSVKSSSSEVSSYDACNDGSCNSACKAMGYKGGFCSGGECYCWKNQGEALGFSVKSPPSEVSSYDACNDGSCNSACKAIGYKGGFCSGGECYCWKNQGNDEASGYSMKSLSSKTSSSKACDSTNCNDLCKTIGYPGGFCSGFDCYCWKNDKKAKVESCNYQACDQLCRRHGFPGGACIGDKCQCDNFDPIPVKRDLLNYLLTSPSKRAHSVNDCGDGPCNDFCSCLGDKCKCRSNQETDLYAIYKAAKDEENDIDQSLVKTNRIVL